MPRHCSAGGCKSRDNHETRNAGVTFHKLPKGATRRTLWISNSHRADSWDPQTDFVYFCSKHFTPESFELSGIGGIRRLKEDAVPTLFDSSPTTKYKRKEGGRQRKQDGIPVREGSQSGEQDNTHQEINQCQTTEEPTVQKTVAATKETNQDVSAFSQAPSRLEQLSQQELSPAPPESRPLSPSRYMRRLPPPPGFYLSKEHSYAQLCPLLWRRRYDQVVDCLEKALRQLHAARRRENRLRSTVLRLRDKRLKHILLLSQNGCKNRGSCTQGGEKRQHGGDPDFGENDTSPKSKNIKLIEDKCVDQMESGCHFLSETSSWSEKEKGYCFYCGRAQEQIGKQLPHVKPTEHEDLLKRPSNVATSTCDTAENVGHIQITRLQRAAWKDVEARDGSVTDSHVLLQNPGVQHMVSAGVCLLKADEQSLHYLGSQQKLLLSDVCQGESDVTSRDHRPDLQHQLLWIQDNADRQVILLTVPTDDGSQHFLTMENVAGEEQAVLLSELDLKGVEHSTDNSGGLARVEAACDEQHSDQNSVSNGALVEMREDVRVKLKEHLEGFHLQLSTEFRH
ncbi:THAP domain-containing protein 7 [Archocentrus centrarchus]|uniref:THAP domain-containing protein 7 n=1 Tax=Archocentrus centrarchus TaxID=63155 RepID=UPI0011EA186C|nr:THAP domain-containing protein 7 [Archocentrus centrarchus]XP_030597302.1 THAP domain-containing protein 7 [Archocentrus centrarchus]